MSRYLKEGIIILILAILVIVTIVLALYNYAPAHKNISTVKSYERTADVSKTMQEISTTDLSVGSSESIIKSYSISSSDLKNYERNDYYDKGRANPFADVENKEDPANTTGDSASGSSNNSNSGNKTNTNNGGTKQEGYFTSSNKNK